jgi:hypothetical protein
MEPMSKRLRVQPVVAALLLSAAMASGACTSDQRHEYLAHTDRVTNGAGDAVAANRATHTIDPWPVHSEKTQIDMDGKRAASASKRYETNDNKPKPQGSNVMMFEAAPKN